MLNIHFGGWFQCRLATEPDPTDEPRGVSGFTFAVAGEPPFDRIIRLQESASVIKRSHTPTVGVTVKEVDIDGEPVPEQNSLYQVLVGAEVDLLDDAMFIGQNYILALARKEPIDPFHLQISKEIDGQRVMLLRRKDLWNPADPELDIYQILQDKKRNLEEVESIIGRRQPIGRDTARDVLQRQSHEVAEATGIFDARRYLQKRLELLEKDLNHLPNTPDTAIQIAALKARIDKLKPEDTYPLLLVKVNYQFDLNGPADMDEDLLQGITSVDVPWPIEFWMGAWDSDALCGYMKGTLSIPFKPFESESIT